VKLEQELFAKVGALMMPDATPWGAREILHFTHINNLTEIVRQGEVYCDAVARNGAVQVEAGDPAIKERRRRRIVNAGPGGFVGDYVPFYFAPRSPMMYRIACDCRDSVPDRYQGGDRELVYLLSTVENVLDHDLDWVASDGNAATGTTSFFDDPHEAEASIDWPLMRATMWNDTADDLDRQRRRMAEFLVHQRVPLTLFDQVAIYSDAYVEAVRAALTGSHLAGRILVRPAWYYGYQRRG
jgi:hypothetical protein